MATENPIMPLCLHKKNINQLSDDDIKYWLNLLDNRISNYTEKRNELLEETKRRAVERAKFQSGDIPSGAQMRKVFAKLDEMNKAQRELFGEVAVINHELLILKGKKRK